MNKELVPEIRFPEFEGEWDEKPMKHVYDFQVTNSLSRESLNYNNGKVKNIHYGDIHTKFRNLFDITREKVPFINSEVAIEKIKKENYCKEGDMIFADASEDLKDIGKSIEIVNLNNEKLLGGLHTLLARPVDEKLAIGFGGYMFESNWARAQIQREAQGAKVLGISANRISNIQILFPSIDEQQKIASCLTVLDELVAAQTEKLELLRSHKKGLMQNLFPQEGESVPRWRFLEFEGEWEERKIGDFIDLLSGIAIKGEEITDNKSGIPILRGINITEGYIRHSEEIDKFYEAENSKIEKFLVKENDIVVAMDGSKVGRNVAKVTKIDENSILIQRVARIRTNRSASIDFIYQYFVTDKFQDYVDRVNTSSGIPHISAQQIADFIVNIPPILKEQQKIASCLTALDELIAAQTEKIALLKEHKKGLMQGLFPKP